MLAMPRQGRAWTHGAMQADPVSRGGNSTSLQGRDKKGHVGHCLSLVPVAVIKMTDRKQLGERASIWS